MLYVWKSPRIADPAEAEALVTAWRAAEASGEGFAPEALGFDASEDVRWFHRELTGDMPPLWNPDKPAQRDDHPNHLVAVPFSQGTAAETYENVFGLAMKYDLVVYDPQRRAVHAPLAEVLAHERATFWPRGAIRAAAAGLVGLAIAVGAYLVNIPILSWIAIAVGLFLFAMALLTFAAEVRARLRPPRGAGGG